MTDIHQLAAVKHLQDHTQQVCHKRQVHLDWQDLSEQAATPLEPSLVASLSHLLLHIPTVISGAGHDAMVIAKTIPSALLFMRSPGGISHHPDETVLEPDIAEAVNAVRRLVLHLAENYDPEKPDAETHGTETHGTETHGTETHGTETHGTETHGTETHGTETHGTETHGTETHGTETHGTETHGTETHGTETHGTEMHGAKEHNSSQISPRAKSSSESA